MTDQELKNEIKNVVISSIEKYIKHHSKNTASFHPLDYLIPVERKIRSIVGGIETSIGTTLWEPLAKSIAKLNGFQVIEKRLQKPQQGMTYLDNIIANIKIIRLAKDGKQPEDINALIKGACQKYAGQSIAFENTTAGQGVDIWIKKSDTNYLFDTKTVRPNVDKFKTLFSQIVDWYGYFYTEYPLEKAECRIVFPYNPFDNKDFWEKSINKGWPLDPVGEAWVGDEFWDFLSGKKGTLALIFEAFMEVKTSKKLEVDFLNLFS